MAQTNSLNIPTTSGTAVIGTGTAFSNLSYSASSGTSNLVSRDSSGNSYFNSSISGYATTATAAGTTTLTVASAQQQYFTGSTTQTVVMPVTSTLVLGQTFTIINNSSGVVTVQSSGANTIQAMAANTQLVLTVISLVSTAAAGWNAAYALLTGTNSIQFTGDVGTAFSTNAVTIKAGTSTYDCGRSVRFNAATPNVTLSITDGSSNTLLGKDAGATNPLTGTRNVALGSAALFSALSNDDCIAIGSQAMQGSEKNERSISIGNFSQSNNTEGSDVIAIGHNCLQALSPGEIVSGVLGIGTNALFTSASDAGNLAIGYYSLRLLNGGDNNLAIGSQSLENVLTGDNNLALGLNSGISLTGAESNNILIKNSGVTGRSNSLAIGASTGTGANQLSRAFISGIANPTLVAGSPTPYLTSQDISNDQLQCLTPVAANTASTAFGQLAVGTALQNTANYPILVNVSMEITSSTAAVILVGVGPTNTPTAQAVTASITVTALPYGFSFVVPAKYYARVTTTGTITVGSITTLTTQIG